MLSPSDLDAISAGGVVNRPRGASYTMRRQADRNAEVRVQHEEVMGWLSRVLSKDVQVADLKSGVVLIELLRAIHPGVEVGKVHASAEVGSFFARDNVKKFYETCRHHFGVPQHDIPEVDEVAAPDVRVFGRRVLLCFLSLARSAFEKYGVEPPDIVKHEIEIEAAKKRAVERRLRKMEELRNARKNAPGGWEDDTEERKKAKPGQATLRRYLADKSDEIDVVMGRVMNELQPDREVHRLEKGEYLFGPDHSLFVRIIRGVPLVRTGANKWEELSSYIERKIVEGFRETPRSSVVGNGPVLGGGGDGDDAGDGELIASGAGSESSAARVRREQAARAEAAELAAQQLADSSGEALVSVGTVGTASLATPGQRAALAADTGYASIGDIEFNYGTEAEALLALIGSVKEPLDDAALELGDRWYKRSGAAQKRQECEADGVTYKKHLEDDRTDVDSFEQIAKDVTAGRSGAACYRDDGLRGFLTKLEESKGEKEVQRELTDVLTAFVNRNREIGYAQGLNNVAHVLMCFMPEEKAFWTLTTMAEDLRARDFYSPNPPMMNGFQAASHMLGRLAARNFPELVEHLSEEELPMVTSMAAMKWLIDVFTDNVPLPANMVVYDYFFRNARLMRGHKGGGGGGGDDDEKKGGGDGDEAEVAAHQGGDAALLCAALGIVEEARDEVLKGEAEAAFETILGKSRTITAQQLLAAMLRGRRLSDGGIAPWFTVAELRELEEDTRKRIKSSWHRLLNQFQLLAEHTKFTPAQLEAIREAYAAAYPDGKAEGLTRAEFEALLKQCEIGLAPRAVRWLYALYGDDNGRADFRELMCCLNVLSEGTVRDRLRLCYDLYDTSGNGLSPEAVDQMAGAMLKMIRHNQMKMVKWDDNDDDDDNEDDEDDFDGVIDMSRLGVGGGYGSEAKRIAGGDNAGALVPFEDVNRWLVSQPQLLQAFALASSEEPMFVLEAPAGDYLVNNKGRGYCACYGSRKKQPAPAAKDAAAGDAKPEEAEGGCVVM